MWSMVVVCSVCCCMGIVCVDGWGIVCVVEWG